MDPLLLAKISLFEGLSHDQLAKVAALARHVQCRYGTVFFREGEPGANEVDDYTSHNTQRLGVGQIKELLLTLPYIQARLADRPYDA